MPLFFLFVLFVVLPIAELYVIIQVGQAIGVVPTLLILLIDGFLGAALTRSQGRSAWLRFNQATAAGRIPAKEVFDGVAIIVGGAFLLAPGFITDFIGLSLLLPPTRAIYGRILSRGARIVGPARSFLFFYDRIPGSGDARRSAPQPPPQQSRTRSPGYDVDGTAREIPETQDQLDRGDER